jgi:hypothetical protein
MNQTLSENRAAALKSHLIENGIKADRQIPLVLVKLNQLILTKLLQESTQQKS